MTREKCNAPVNLSTFLTFLMVNKLSVRRIMINLNFILFCYKSKFEDDHTERVSQINKKSLQYIILIVKIRKK